MHDKNKYPAAFKAAAEDVMSDSKAGKAMTTPQENTPPSMTCGKLVNRLPYGYKPVKRMDGML